MLKIVFRLPPCRDSKAENSKVSHLDSLSHYQDYYTVQ